MGDESETIATSPSSSRCMPFNIMKLVTSLLLLFVSQSGLGQLNIISSQTIVETSCPHDSIKFVCKAYSQLDEPIFIINNLGRVYDPISINFLKLSNIERIETGKSIKKKKGLVTVYLKDGVQLIPLKKLLKRYKINRKDGNRLPVCLDSTIASKPKKIFFDPSQSFCVQIISHSKEGHSRGQKFIRISLDQ